MDQTKKDKFCDFCFKNHTSKSRLKNECRKEFQKSLDDLYPSIYSQVSWDTL